jgi:hypothetical protein
MPIEFIKADFEITSNEDLEKIREAFSRQRHRISELYCGQNSSGSYLASFEIHLDLNRDNHTAEEKIHGF